ncbi:hypothetical protein C8R45DRAFT_936310 [Mycena sanguinolenta]|nr:hypothetical protein C8R45DRAFT_936310 [Mycena sanguinolenta]
MDDFYPYSKAADAIQAWNKRLSAPEAPFSSLRLTMPSNTMETSSVSIYVNPNQRGARTIIPADSHGPTREAVFTLVGALTAKDLPLLSKSQIKPSAIRRARQHATIAGFNTACFQSAIDKIKDLSFEMSRHFDEQDILTWCPTDDSVKLGHTVSGNCRYFTLGSDIREDQKTSFDKLTDPHGVLQQFVSPSVAHCFDNDVAYMALNNNSYVDHNPAFFRTGDIVEMGFTIVTWQINHDKSRGPRFGIQLVLRTLTFLDGAFTKEAAFTRKEAARHKSIPKGPSIVINPIAKLRNRQVFEADNRATDESEQVDQVGTKMARMMMVGDIDCSVVIPNDAPAGFRT